MSTGVLLDAGPLGMVSNPSGTPEPVAARQWLQARLTQATHIYIPEIADYEVRRELLRVNKSQGIARLDALRNTLIFLPLTSEVMLTAAEFWAQARRRGRPTADPAALDCDVILAAQAALLKRTATHDAVLVATTNLSHLSLFVDARLWHQIR